MLNDLFEAGRINSIILNEVGNNIKPGVFIDDLYSLVDTCFKRYQIKIIPNTTSASLNINNIIFHGLYSNKQLLKSDILTVDICFEYNGFLIDGAKTYSVDNLNYRNSKIINYNKKMLNDVIKIIDAGVKVSTVLSFINEHVSKSDYYLYPDAMGHGIGKRLHASPLLSLTNYIDFDYVFKIGDIFTIEPIIFDYPDDVYVNKLNEGVISEGNISSQIEITIYIEKKGGVHILNSGVLN